MPPEDRAPLPPETVNSEQDDDETQAQAVARDALDSTTAPFGLDESDKVSTGDDSDDVPDLVDHMRQMASSGVIDMSAFRGERNDDDEDGCFGEGADEE